MGADKSLSPHSESVSENEGLSAPSFLRQGARVMKKVLLGGLVVGGIVAGNLAWQYALARWDAFLIAQMDQRTKQVQIDGASVDLSGIDRKDLEKKFIALQSDYTQLELRLAGIVDIAEGNTPSHIERVK